ncbi:MAG: DNA ligase D [Parachlamydiaceae bacterium]|nr:DNA ligase D [Parachlamydiaceae bacterium]
MSLKEYHSKRDFKETAEPKGQKSKTSIPSFNFCVQKHAARNLHYDFRLEYRGVLLSWAVPKGPSMNPKDKRLAIHVEDHPLEYQYFEGTIPKGEYGAGTVEIWDHGTYTVPESKPGKDTNEKMSLGLAKGHLEIILAGKKLKGHFVIQKLKKDDPSDKSWLLIKMGDEYAVEDSDTENSKSLTPVSKKKTQKIPTFISPMLATLVPEAFNGNEWLFEIKWDGYRGLAWLDAGKVKLMSRNELDLSAKFPSIIKELKKMPGQAIFDGELVVLDSEGKSQFQLMQNYQKTGKGALYYYVFDLLFKDGMDLRDLPLIERKEILKKTLSSVPLEFVRYSDHVMKSGNDFFKKAVQKHLEGVVGKSINSTYQSRRSRDWVKIKSSLRQEVVIGGFTDPRGSRKKFGALLVGIYGKDKKLQYSGHVGGGFTETLLQDTYDQLKPLIQTKSPFNVEPKPNMPVTWVKPSLVCEVSFAEWTQDNIMRQPIFQGLRIDKSPKAVSKESPEVVPSESSVRADSKRAKGKMDNEKDLVLSHQDKIYWPKEKYTKGDLLEYYREIAPFILPYLKDKPLMLHRFPNGINGMDFYQKDINFSSPEWIKTYPIKHEEKTDTYIIIDSLKSLLFAVNLGSIELHPFISNIKNLNNPDFCVIDLDPLDISFDKVVEAALVTHKILDNIGVKNFCKTSGLTGLQILIPLKGKYSFEQSKQFAEIIVSYVHQELPAFTSMERSPAKRAKKIYLDFLQNRFAQTIVSPYSVRPASFAPVSTPLLWEEVSKKLNPKDFNIKTVPARVHDMGDLLKPILSASTNIGQALTKLERIGESSPTKLGT